MIGVQYEFMPRMIQGPEYNCSSVMPPGPEWATRYGVKQYRFGIYSLVFGIIVDILYLPCTLALRKEVKTSCFKGAVYCSHRVLSLGTGIIAYWIWCTASACCLVLGLNRLFEMVNLSRFFSATRTNIYLGICTTYGLFMTFFTRPVSVNSALQAVFFSPFIPGHGLEEYVNWPHAVHNMVIASGSFVLYATLVPVIVTKSRSVVTDANRSRVSSNINTVFVQVMLICAANLIATTFSGFICQNISKCVYVYMNFMTSPPALIVVGHMAFQFVHGLPPFIYLALNTSIRSYALRASGLERLFASSRASDISTTHATGTR